MHMIIVEVHNEEVLLRESTEPLVDVLHPFLEIEIDPDTKQRRMVVARGSIVLPNTQLYRGEPAFLFMNRTSFVREGKEFLTYASYACLISQGGPLEARTRLQQLVLDVDEKSSSSTTTTSVISELWPHADITETENIKALTENLLLQVGSAAKAEQLARDIYVLYLKMLYNTAQRSEVAYCIYRSGSAFNHSCAPNAKLEWVADARDPKTRGYTHMSVRSLRPIKRGEQVTIAYDQRILGEKIPTETRRALLLNLYNFWCTCERCTTEQQQQQDGGCAPKPPLPGAAPQTRTTVGEHRRNMQTN